jgi:OOP family OmpA-OmpF porin
MNNTFYSGLALIAMLAAPAVHAVENNLYVGAAIAGGGTVVIQTQAGRFENTNSAHPFKLYGGYDITEHVAIEAGYASYGKFRFASPGTVDLSGLHVAAKGSMALGKSFSVFGKLGAVRHSMDVAGIGAESFKTTKTRALMGFGFDYRIIPQLAATLELTNYGTIKSRTGQLRVRQLELGLKYHF